MKSQRRSGLRLLKEIQIRLTFPTWHQQWVSCHDALPCNSETRSSNICLHIHIYIPSMTNWYPNPTSLFSFLPPLSFLLHSALFQPEPATGPKPQQKDS